MSAHRPAQNAALDGRKPKEQRLFVHSFDAHDLGLLGNDPRFLGLEHRAFGLAGPGDVVVVGTAPDDAWLDHVFAGRERPEVILVAHRDRAQTETDTLANRLLADPGALQHARDFVDRVKGSGQFATLSVYMGGDAEDQLAAALDIPLLAADAATTAWANRKSSLHDILNDAGVARIPGIVCERHEVAAGVRRIAERFPARGVVVRADRSTAGSGVWMLDAQTAVSGWNIPRGPEDTTRDRVLIDPRLRVRSSPNAQYWLGDDRCLALGVTDQRLSPDGTGHRGNLAPVDPASLPSVEHHANAVAEALRGHGIRGVVGIDLIVCDPDDPLATESAVFAVEINARVNTSTFGLFIRAERPYSFAADTPPGVVIIPNVHTPGCTSFAAMHDRLCANADDWADAVLVTRPPSPGRENADLAIHVFTDRDWHHARDAAEARLATITGRLCDTH